MCRRYSERHLCRSFRLPTSLFPVLQRIYADAKQRREFGLKRSAAIKVPRYQPEPPVAQVVDLQSLPQ